MSVINQGINRYWQLVFTNCQLLIQTPIIITDKDGKASFEYFNADGKSTYRVVVEGIDADGNLGRQVFTYKVE